MATPDAFPAVATWYPHRVSYGETDCMGVLYYGEYLHIFERARSAYIREYGMSYAEVERRGVILPVREAHCRYRKSAHFDDLIQVHVAISEWGRASMTFVYEVWNEERAQLLSTGHTQHACMGPEGKPVAVPDWLRALFT